MIERKFLEPYFFIDPNIFIDYVEEQIVFSAPFNKMLEGLGNDIESSEIEELPQAIPSFNAFLDLFHSLSKGINNEPLEDNFIHLFSSFPLDEFFRFITSSVSLYTLLFTPKIRKFIFNKIFASDHFKWFIESKYLVSFDFDNIYLLYRLIIGSEYNRILPKDLKFFSLGIHATEDREYRKHLGFTNAIKFIEDTDYAISISQMGKILVLFDNVLAKLLGITLILEFSDEVPDNIEELFTDVNRFGPHDLFFRFKYAKKFPDYPHSLVDIVKQSCNLVNFNQKDGLPEHFNFYIQYGKNGLFYFDTNAFVLGIEQLIELDDKGILVQSLEYFLPFCNLIIKEFSFVKYPFIKPGHLDDSYQIIFEHRDYPSRNNVQSIIDAVWFLIFRLTERFICGDDPTGYFNLIYLILTNKYFENNS